MKISIVMPLYNAERYLQECLDSVLGQTFTEFELLCINDCSNDRTADILQTYSARDERIKVFVNEERKGAAYSRNRGLAEAKGQYLFFLDGDDIFDEGMLQAAYQKAVESEADIVEFQSIKTTTDNIFLKRTNKLGTSFERIFCRQPFAVKNLNVCDYITFRSSPWDKIYRRQFIVDEKIWFQELSCCNDVYFVNMALLMARKMIWMDTDRIFVHVRDHDSPYRISTDRDPMCAYYADKRILEEVSARGQMPNLYRHCYARIYFHLITTLKLTKNKRKAEEFYLFLQREGIGKLQNIGEKYYQASDEYIKEGFDRFLNQSYESGWYQEAGELEAYLQENQESVFQLFADWKKKGKKVGLWGVGQNGRIFARFCHQHHIEIDLIMDRDERKHGRSIFGFPPVCSPEEGIKQVQAVIFTNKDILNAVKESLTGGGDKVEMVDINAFLGVY